MTVFEHMKIHIFTAVKCAKCVSKKMQQEKPLLGHCDRRYLLEGENLCFLFSIKSNYLGGK